MKSFFTHHPIQSTHSNQNLCEVNPNLPKPTTEDRIQNIERYLSDLSPTITRLERITKVWEQDKLLEIGLKECQEKGLEIDRKVLDLFFDRVKFCCSEYDTSRLMDLLLETLFAYRNYLETGKIEENEKQPLEPKSIVKVNTD